MVERLKDRLAKTNSPELSDEELASLRPAHEVMPPAFFEAVKRQQGSEGGSSETLKRAAKRKPPAA
jgi:uncharacterized protein (DUF4415 family)